MSGTGGEGTVPGPGMGAQLLARLDDASALIDQGDHWKALEHLRDGRWRDGIDLSGVPEASWKRAQQWVDAATDVLHSRPVDVHLVRRLLLEARRALAS